ncbi:MAG: GDSL family lipase [Thermoguttaceae bacterium]|nr:GDSL family lipase [Thermoguttaceae bacterium]
MKKDFRCWCTLPFACIFLSLFTLALTLSPLPSAAEPLTEAQTAEIHAAKLEAAVVPDPDINHLDRFEEKAKIVSEGKIELVFLGDSITHHWDNAGKNVQKKYFGDIRLVNLGMGWNRTQHVLWELETIEAEKISPKAVMVMIGTNNLGKGRRPGDVVGGTPDEIVAGNAAIVKKIRELWPNAKILLLGDFPRGHQPTDPYREKIAKANAELAKLADKETVFFMDLTPNLLDDDGFLQTPITPDFLHLTPAGYEIWARAVSPVLHAWVME